MPKSLPISKADAARAKGVTKGAVSLAVRPGGPLRAALLESGRIDSAHRAYRAWLGREPSDGAPTTPTKSAKAAPEPPTASAKPAKKKRPGPTPKRPEPPPPPPLVPAPDSLGELEEIRALLKPLTDRFGTSRHFRDWLLSLKDIEVILEKHLGNEEAQGRLIARELVRAHVFGALNAMARRLLQDAPKTIARRLAAHFKANGTVEDAERMVRENLSSQIEPVKAKAARTLREAA